MTCGAPSRILFGRSSKDKVIMFLLMREAVKSFFSAEGFFISLIVLLVLASFSPILFFGKAFFDEEQIGFYYPHSFFYSQALREGTSLLWNNGYYAGISVPFDQFVSAYFPINRLLFSFFPWIDAHHWSIFIGILSGCIFAYFFGRSFRFSKGASFILSSSYLLATTFGWLDMTLSAWSFFMIPALFLAILKASRGERPLLWTILGGIFIGIGFLAGFAQVTIYGYVIAGAFALCLAFFNDVEKSDFLGKSNFKKSGRLRVILSFATMTVLGILFSLPQTLPSLLLVGDSIRTTSHALQNIFPLKPANLTAFILPEYFNIPFLGGGTQGFYVGALPFLAALFGLFLARTKIQIFFAVIYAALLLVSFHIPPLSWLNDYLPPFSRFSSSSRWSIAASFPLAFLAASGYENLLRPGALSEREKRIFRIIGLGLVILFLTLVAVNVGLAIFEKMPDLRGEFVDWYIRGKTSALSREHYLNVLGSAIRDARSALSFLDWRVIIPFLFLGVSYFLIRRFREGKIAKESFEKIAAALVVFNVIFISGAIFDRAYFPASILAERPRIVQAIEGRENNFESFRIAGFLIGDSIFRDITSKRKLTTAENAKLIREVLALNTNILYGIDRLDGAEYYRTLRHNQILDTIIFPRGPYVLDREALRSFTGPLDKVYNREIWKDAAFEERIKDLEARLPLLSAFNVKYIYSLVSLSSKELQEIPLPSALPEEVPIRLYENKNVLPRVYFPEKVKFFVGNENELLGMMVDNQDFQKTAFVECSSCPLARGGIASSSTSLYQDGILKAEVNTNKGEWLIFSESFSPGWEARIDRVEIPIYRANYIMQAIYVPAGKHKVEFKHVGVIAENWKKKMTYSRNFWFY